MARRTKIILAVLAVLTALSVGYIANAWFVSMSRTPPGVVRSALVRCLPESGPERDVDSLLTYGSLISGSSVDDEGVPIVIPGDWLLSTDATATDGATTTRTVRTSRARDFQGAPDWPADETPGTVLHSDIRRSGDAAVTRTQRDLMDAAETDTWTKNGAPLEGDPGLHAADYTIVTQAATNVDDSVAGKTITTTTLTTTYTPRDPAGNPGLYVHIHQSVETVTHEDAVFSPSGAWTDEEFYALSPWRTMTETVLSVRGAENPDAPTRTYLVLTETRPNQDGDVTTDEPKPLPLALGNLSTADTAIRVGITATLQRSDGTAEPLRLEPSPGGDGKYYLGLDKEGLGFVELFAFHPAQTADYGWTYNSAASTGTAWSLWDLTMARPAELDPAAPFAETAVPPIPSPTPPPSAGPEATPDPEAEPVPADYYAVLDELSVVAKSAFLGADQETAFEAAFNQLYCTGAPTITLRVRYYARQNDYMNWSEFYSQSLTLNIAE